MLSVEQRLARLESSVRRWRVVSVALVGLVGFMAADFPVERLKTDGEFRHVVCQSLMLVDDKGGPVCTVMQVGGEGVLELAGKSGKTGVYSGLDGILIRKNDGTKKLIQ